MSALPAAVRQRATGTRPRRDRERRHLRVVEDQPHRHPVLFLIAYVALTTAVVLGAVSLNALAAGGAVRARELSQQVSLAERQYGLLVAEVASLEDPSRIRQAAERAGMVLAEDPRFLQPDRALPTDTPPPAPGDDAIKPLLTADGR